MNPLRWFSAALVGAVLSAGLILACSDDSPRGADAAVCDCPSAEPPLAGRIVEVDQTGTLPAGALGFTGAACPSGAVILGGGCIVESVGPGPGMLLLNEAGRRFDTPSYECQWWSTLQSDSTGKATAICLLPAP